MLIILFLSVCFLAFSNGANDNFKSVATLFGSKTTDYKRAILWATVTTLSGMVAADFLAEKLVSNFSGEGLVPDVLVHSPEFAISVALAFAVTLFSATKIGMPVSTTHVSVGSIFGIGSVTIKADINVVRNIIISWIFTLPIAAIFGSIFYLVLISLR